MDSRRQSVVFLGTVLFLCLAARPPEAAAQERVQVGGVFDAASGAPIAGASITVQPGAYRAMTNERGEFATGFPEGPFSLHVRALGYETAALVLTGGLGGDTLLVSLSPDPVILEGLTVTVDRLRARRNASGVSVRVVDRTDLASSATGSLGAYLRSRAMVVPTPCSTALGQASGSSALRCVRSRGSVAPATVYLDEAPAIGGLDMLDLYRADEIALVEVYRGGQMIRIYTVAFVERLAGRPWIPQPL